MHPSKVGGASFAIAGVALAVAVTLVGVVVARGSRPAQATLLPFQVTKVAETSSVQAGGTVYYSITVHNPNDTYRYVDDITDTLPAGFSYHPKSTSGVTSQDPTSVTGQTLDWFLDGEQVGGGASITLSFAADVSLDEPPATYCNEAAATRFDESDTTGPTAPVRVGLAYRAAALPNLTEATCQPPPPPSMVRTATPTSTPAPKATATSVPPTPTSTATAASTVLAAVATPRPAVGAAAAGIHAPNTGSGPEGGSGDAMTLALIGGATLAVGATLAAAGLRKR